MKDKWIQVGYENFARQGPQGLTVEGLARQVQTNKSSFYHYFSDLDRFTQLLLEHHLVQSKVMAEKELNCDTQEELVEIIVAHKVDLLFNRQLRIYRDTPQFKSCFERALEIATPAVMSIWPKVIGLTDQSYLAALVFKLGIENFYLRITDDNLNPNWLNNYFAEFRQLIRAFKESPSHSIR